MWLNIARLCTTASIKMDHSSLTPNTNSSNIISEGCKMTDEVKKMEQFWVSPSFVDDDACREDGVTTYHLMYEIPGSNKEGIRLRALNDRLRLTAPRGSSAEYVSDISFCCDADPSQVSARYGDGILNVDVPVMCPDPFQDVPEVPIE